MPLTVIRCAATVPAAKVPAAIVSRLAIASSPRAFTESSGSPIASATICTTLVRGEHQRKGLADEAGAAARAVY